MINQTGIDKFWVLNQTYRHMSYRGKFRCIGINNKNTHVILHNLELKLILEVPCIKRHMFMYKYGGLAQLGERLLCKQ